MRGFSSIYFLRRPANLGRMALMKNIGNSSLLCRGISSIHHPDPVVVSKVSQAAVGMEILLPSKNERCLFTLKPFSSTVADLYSMVSSEDGGVERVAVYREDGVKIAKSTTISKLLCTPFKLVINDHQFNVECGEAIDTCDHTDYERLREHVLELSAAMSAQESRAAKEEQLLEDISRLKSELEPLVSAKRALEESAAARCERLTWVGLGLMGFQFGFLARLTWWEYSWDIMEPVTYFVTYGTAAAMYAYYTLTKQEYVFPDVRRRLFQIALHKKAEKTGLDTQKLGALQGELEEKEALVEKYKSM